MRAIERRAYLRHEDDACASHLPVSTEQADLETAEALLGLDSVFSLRRDLYRLELEAHELRREVSDQDRTLGSFLHNLNRRMELMTSVVLDLSDHDVANVQDLSPAGIAYTTPHLLQVDDLLALKLVFKKVSLGIACFGRIRYNLLVDNDLYQIGVQFISLDEATESLLTRHIAALQAQARRERLHKL